MTEADMAVLRVTVAMLEYEALCHEESGDPKRRGYVAPIRKQVAAAYAVLGSFTPVPLDA